MEKLTIEKRPCGSLETVKITGFTEQELSKLKSMDHESSQDFLVEMLNARNNGIGTQWQCGYGIYSLWYDNEAAYMNIGKSCD